MVASPIVGGFSTTRSSQLADNDAYNLIVEVVETKDGKAMGALLNSPGLDLITSLGTGPIRGARDLNDILYVVSGGDVYSLTPNGIATLLGSIGYRTTPVSMFENGLQMMIVDGSGGWLVPGGYPLVNATIDAPGGLYAVGDTITLQPTNTTTTNNPIITVTSVANAPVATFTLTNAGTAYNTASAVATTPINGQPGSGSGLTLNVGASGLGITSLSVAAGGSGYSVGDTGFIDTGTNDAVYYVHTVGTGGAVTGVLLVNPGTYYNNTTGAATTPAPGVSANAGLGFTVNITAANGPISNATLADSGHGYAVGNAGFITGGTADATYLVTAVGQNGAVTGFTVTQAGAAHATIDQFTQKSTSGSGSGLTLKTPIFGNYVGVSPVTLPFPKPMMGDVSDGFGLLIFENSPNIAQSDNRDLSTWQALNYGVADQSPDNNMGVKIIHNEAYILKQRNTEVWVDQGQAGFSFLPLQGVHMEWGLWARFSLAKAGDVLMWISKNEQGQYLVVAAAAYQVKPISTQALIAEFETYPNIGDAIGFCFQQGGHTFYVLTLPEADRTWIYDMTTSAMMGFPVWTRLAAWQDGAWHRHWGNCFWPWIGTGAAIVTITQNQAKSVRLTNGLTLATASGLVGMQTSFSNAVFSVWLNLPDSLGASGMIFSNQTDDTHATTNPGLFISIQNDAAGSPEMTVEAWDANNAVIVSATYTFTTWTAWVNVLISIDTATKTLQVYANTLVNSLLSETLLTPAAITWTSANPIAASATQPWHLTTSKATAQPTLGASIAQLIIPSDSYGTPNGVVIDWPRKRVFLVNSTAARLYNATVTTQNPVISAPIVNNYVAEPAIDPVTGNLITVVIASSSNILYQYNPTTLAQTGTFGTAAAIPQYPNQLNPVGQIVCVGVGTVASNGSTQVGYAVTKDPDNFGLTQVVRVDNMTAAGFSADVVVNAASNRALLCAGPSGPTAGIAYLIDSAGASTTILTALKLYAMTITSGAEQYNISSWPTPNPHIVGSVIGSVTAAAIDPTATYLSSSGIGYDATNNVIVVNVITNGTNLPHAIIGLNPSTAALLWKVAVSNVNAEDFYTSQIDGQVIVQTSSGLTATGMDVIDTTTGALSAVSLPGVNYNSPAFAANGQLEGVIVLNTAYIQTAGGPTPVTGTPTSFTGYAVMTGIGKPPDATMADLWFTPTASFVDMTQTYQRRNWVSEMGGAPNLGSNGSAPINVPPVVFLSAAPGNPGQFATNLGRGGPFTPSATLEAGLTDPPAVDTSTMTPNPGSIGRGMLGDYRNGNLYAFNPKALTDNGTPRRWLRRWRGIPVASESAERYCMLTVDMETGLKVPDGTTPHVSLRWSNDGGNTWSNERIKPVGQNGQTNQTVRFNRLGMTRRFKASNRIFEISSDDIFPVSITSADVEVS